MADVAPDGSVTFTISSLESAISHGASLLGVPEERVHVEVLRPGRLRRWLWPGRRLLVRVKAICAEDRDGRFALEYEAGIARLTVHPPNGRGRPVRCADVEAALASSPILMPDHHAVQRAVTRATGQPVVVGQIQPGEEVHGSCGLVMSQDHMAAYLVASQTAAEAAPTAEEVTQALQAAGVVQGIDQLAVEEFIASAQPGETRLVARGVRSEPGDDADVCEVVPIGHGRPRPRETDDGRADYYNLGVIRTVPVGAPLLLKMPPGPGTPGFTVLGEQLPARPGTDLDLERMAGQGTRCSEDGNQLLAGISGMASRVGGKLCVFPVHRIRGDVDFSTGNVDFLGTVIVDGGVKSGFKIRSAGDIIVSGVVEAATLVAGGKIVLRAGIFGRDEGSAVAGGDLLAGFVEASTVRAGGHVRVAGEIVRSVVEARGSVSVTGAIIGGRITSGGRISTKVVGSPAGVLTTMTLPPRSSEDADDDPQAGGERVRPVVRVSGRVYPPARINIGRAQLRVRTITQYSTFFESGGRVGLLPYY